MEAIHVSDRMYWRLQERAKEVGRTVDEVAAKMLKRGLNVKVGRRNERLRM